MSSTRRRPLPQRPYAFHTSGTVALPLAPASATLAMAITSSRAAVAWGWVSTSGHYGLHANPYPREITGTDRATITELRALAHALTQIRRARLGIPVHLLTRSPQVTHHLAQWAAGNTVLPAPYAATHPPEKPSTLRSLAVRTRHMSHRGELSWAHVNSGHTLHLVADNIARLAMATSHGGTRADALTQAETYATHALTTHPVEAAR